MLLTLFYFFFLFAFRFIILTTFVLTIYYRFVMQRLITSNVRKCRCIGEFFRIQLVKTTSIALERTYSVAMLLRQGARNFFGEPSTQESCEVDEGYGVDQIGAIA